MRNLMDDTADLEFTLAPHLKLVRLRAEAALVRRLNAGYGFADARIPAEVYLRDDAARERMSRDSLRPQASHAAQYGEITAAIADATTAAQSALSPLTELCKRFALDAAEQALVGVAVAYELDADVRDLCHALAWRRRSALFADVCRDLAPELATSRDLLRALHPGGALRRSHLVTVGNEHGAGGDFSIGSTVAVDRRVLDWLLGDDRIAEPLNALIRLYDPTGPIGPPPVHIDDSVLADIERVAGALSRQLDRGETLPAVLIQAPPGAGKQAVAHRLANKLGRCLAVISLRGAVAMQVREREFSALDRALSEARLRNALAYLAGVEVLRTSPSDSAGPDDGMSRQAAIRTIECYGGIVILATAERGMPSLPMARPFHLIRLPTANVETRQKAWSLALAALAEGADSPRLADTAAGELAARYVIGPGAIGEVIENVRAFARATGEPATRKSVEEAVGRRLTLRLGSFGTLITRKARLDEMVLPEDVVEAMNDMIAMVRERTQILERWGYGEHLGLNRGVSALFSGEPGTGKTMAASVIAGALGLELIRIDLSAVTSKWVGETEKHLATIFDEAQSANAMLLFDEADSLFGKRTELKSAQDRYANLEVNYVLQRMENFDGISILTTNFESAVDPAFLRRINFRVRFPSPEVEEREELWRRLLPPDTGIADRVDFQTLAERFEMTGGHIRNAIVRAAVVAARNGRAMQPQDLLTGAHHEYSEMGKVMPSLLD
ncbi:MAG: ATP-binding protein [Proteobacteria bacterium]|nr:ATP-binding protein [Pseudomonadota bacterium]